MNRLWIILLLWAGTVSAQGYTHGGFPSGVINTKTVADGTNDLFEVALASGQTASGWVTASVKASNGTDHQTRQFNLRYSAVNKAGVYTTSIQLLNTGTQSVAASSGTLTVTSPVIVSGTNKITIRVTFTGSLTETVYQCRFTILNLSPPVTVGSLIANWHPSAVNYDTKYYGSVSPPAGYSSTAKTFSYTFDDDPPYSYNEVHYGDVTTGSGAEDPSIHISYVNFNMEVPAG